LRERKLGSRSYPAKSSEAQDEHEGFVDGAKLVRVEASGGTAESLRIDDGGLLD
jgi:hypothetical protein